MYNKMWSIGSILVIFCFVTAAKSAHFPIPPDACSTYDLCPHVLPITSLFNELDNNGFCYESGKCRVTNACDLKYSVQKDRKTLECQKDGSWKSVGGSGSQCPDCESIFGLGPRHETEEIFMHKRNDQSINFKLKMTKKPGKDFFISVLFNKNLIASYNLYSRKSALPSEIFSNFPSDKSVRLTSSNYVPSFIYNQDGTKFLVTVDLKGMEVSKGGNEFTFLVVDYNSRYGFGEQFVVHNYTKVFREYIPCGRSQCPLYYDCQPVDNHGFVCIYNEELERRQKIIDALNKGGEQKVHDDEVEYNYGEDRGSCEVANCPDYYYCVPVGLKSHTCVYNAQLAKKNPDCENSPCPEGTNCVPTKYQGVATCQQPWEDYY